MICGNVTLEQYNSLLASYNSGVLESTHRDKKVKYRSLEEMKEILDDMEFCLGSRIPQSRRRGVIKFKRSY